MLMGQIARHWDEKQEFIEHQGFHFPDDTIIPVSFERGGRVGLKMGEPISINTLPALYLEQWEGGTIFSELVSGDLLIVGGERHSHGSAGFVAVSRNSSPPELLWLVLLDWSNPFTGLRVVGREIEATSSLEEIWRFSLDPPYRIVPPPEDFD
jgi:hypothetical protein